MGIGKLQENPPVSRQQSIHSAHVGANSDEIDRFRFLAANIPLTNVFLIDSNLNYVLAEGPNFEYWGLKNQALLFSKAYLAQENPSASTKDAYSLASW